MTSTSPRHSSSSTFQQHSWLLITSSLNSLLVEGTMFLVPLLPPWLLSIFFHSLFLVNTGNFHVVVLAYCFPLYILTHESSGEEDTVNFSSSSSRDEKLFHVTDENLGHWLGHSMCCFLSCTANCQPVWDEMLLEA